MKTILYIVGIIVTLGAAYFTFQHSTKFEELQKTRLATIKQNADVTANAEATEKNLSDERGVLNAAENKREEYTQSVSALKSTAAASEREIKDLDLTLNETVQETDKILTALKTLGQNLGEDVTPENLPAKIEQIENDRKAKTARVEELDTLIAAADKQLATNREEVDRLVKRDVERNARIGRNSMESVITAVNQDWGFLVIGAGSNSGFTPQTSLIVERDGRRIGMVRPSAIEPTQTIAEIDYASLAPGVRLQPGDRVILATPASN